MPDKNSLGGVLKRLVYGSLPINNHPIDTYEDDHGFGPFRSAFAPWEFADPASDVNQTWSAGSNLWGYSPPAVELTLFSDPSGDRVNQILGALTADAHQQQSSGWLHDVLDGAGQGMLPSFKPN